MFFPTFKAPKLLLVGCKIFIIISKILELVWNLRISNSMNEMILKSKQSSQALPRFSQFNLLSIIPSFFLDPSHINNSTLPHLGSFKEVSFDVGTRMPSIARNNLSLAAYKDSFVI